MRIRLFGVSVAAVTVLGLTAPAEAQRSGRLELSGSRSASVDLVIRQEAELLPDAFRVRTKGTYAGIAVLDSAGDVLALALNVQPWIAARPTAAERPVTTVLERTVLLPGRYRLLLLTDGPSTVSLPARGAFVRSLRATTPYDDEVVLMSPSSLDAVPPVHRASVPTDLRDARFVLMAHHIETTAMRAQVAGMCLAPRGGQVCRPQDLGFTKVRHGAADDPNGWVRSELSGPTLGADYDLRREFDVRFDDATVDEPGRHYGLVVVI